jgi:hypothetical protein
MALLPASTMMRASWNSGDGKFREGLVERRARRREPRRHAEERGEQTSRAPAHVSSCKALNMLHDFPTR